MAKKLLGLFDIRAWYIGHIIALVLIAFGGAWHTLALFNLYGNINEIIFHILLLSLASVYAYIFDTLFHNITGLD